MKRSKHSLSYTHLFSCDLGELIPAGMVEVLPGDSLQMQTRALVRCAPMLAPPMHPVRVRIHHWYVPFRIIWDNFESFITGGADGNDATVFPTKTGGLVGQGTLINYLGAPVTTIPNYSVLPLRAYQLIWNEWYRDQDLQTAAGLSRGDGSDSSTSTSLQNCCWEKDYFTSARPWEQKGPTVTIPLAGNAPVKGIGAIGTTTSTVAGVAMREPPPLPSPRTPAFGLVTSAASQLQVEMDGAASATNKPLIYADLSQVSGVSVNQLRQSLAIQRFEEARAMYGSRYPEYLRALGVRSSDARLSRPEYLGGGVQTIQFSEVPQTAADGANPVSTLRGHGLSALRSNRFRRFFEEHGYVMTMFSVLPKTIYMNGLFRTWNRRTKFDFWQRELEQIGQQAVLNKEIRANHASPDGTFGYSDRYDEYRRQESRVSGEFSQSSLDYWHFARNFASDPSLNSTFVSAVPSERPFAAPSADVLYVHAQHSIQARRLVSKRAIPRTF